MYADVREIADAALAHGGGTYHCESHGQAVHWQQRFYRFRKLFAEVHFPAGEGMSPYDRLVLPRVPEGGCTVTLNLREQVGTFIPARPQPINISGDDELFDIASKLAEKIREGDT